MAKSWMQTTHREDGTLQCSHYLVQQYYYGWVLLVCELDPGHEKNHSMKNANKDGEKWLPEYPDMIEWDNEIADTQNQDYWERARKAWEEARLD